MDGRAGQKRRGLAFGPGGVRVAIVGRKRMTRLAAGHVEVAISFAPGETPKRCEAPIAGAWIRGMFSLSPESLARACRAIAPNWAQPG